MPSDSCDRSDLATALKRLCWIFCCPPIPSRIAEKVAFHPPSDPSYRFIPDDPCGYKFKVDVIGNHKGIVCASEVLPAEVEGFFAETSRGNCIACLFVRCNPHSKYTILYSHPNGDDIGTLLDTIVCLGSLLDCNILTYDYSGYGLSSGEPSEKNMYADIEAAYHALKYRFGIDPENIVVHGSSLGTVPTVDLASKQQVAGVILDAPLTSALRVVCPSVNRTCFFDVFRNIDKVPAITAPVLVIHGTEDEIIDFSHGTMIYKLCPNAVEPLWIKGAGHNDIMESNTYFTRVVKFLTVDLAK